MCAYKKSSILSYLRLARSENVGPVTFKSLLDIYKTPDAAIDATPKLAANGGASKRLNAASLAKVEEELALTSKYGADLISLFDPRYPLALQALKDAPPFLTVFGRQELLNQTNKLAIVGARNASLNSLKFAQNLSSELGHKGFIIASGLALGIDSSAHKGAIANRHDRSNRRRHRPYLPKREHRSLPRDWPKGAADQRKPFCKQTQPHVVFQA
jgi:DNA processing protein